MTDFHKRLRKIWLTQVSPDTCQGSTSSLIKFDKIILEPGQFQNSSFTSCTNPNGSFEDSLADQTPVNYKTKVRKCVRFLNPENPQVMSVVPSLDTLCSQEKEELWWSDSDMARIRRTAKAVAVEVEQRGYAVFFEKMFPHFDANLFQNDESLLERLRELSNEATLQIDASKEPLKKWSSYGHITRGLERMCCAEHRMRRFESRQLIIQWVVDFYRIHKSSNIEQELWYRDFTEKYTAMTRPSMLLSQALAIADHSAVQELPECTSMKESKISKCNHQPSIKFCPVLYGMGSKIPFKGNEIDKKESSSTNRNTRRRASLNSSFLLARAS